MPDTRIIDTTSITRLIACKDSEFSEVLKEYESYKEYTLFLVNNGVTVEDNSYSDLYYGDRKVTDLFFTNTYPGNEEYPDDKIYIQPVRDNDKVWKIDGQDLPAPVGYNIYFKHDGIVTPVATSGISSISYDSDDQTIILTWTTDEGITVTSKLLTEETVESLLNNIFNSLSEEEKQTLANQLYPFIKDRINADLVEPLSERVDEISQNSGVLWESIQ